jgi:hypothetical protein
MNEQPVTPTDATGRPDSEKRMVLIGIAILLETTEHAMEERMEQLSVALESAVQQVAKSQPECKPMNVISYHYLGDEAENAAQCSRCAAWASDRNKPDRIDGIETGSMVAGQFLCEQCRSSGDI